MFSIVSLGTALLAARAVSSAPTYGGSGSSGMGMSGDSSNNYGGGGYAGGNAMNTVDTSMAMASSMMAESSTAAAMMDTTSAAMMDTTSAAMMDTTSAAMMTESTMMMDTSTMMASEAMSTSSMMMDTTSAAMASMATYGSGSSSWNSGGYQDCVQQCMASYGNPMMGTYTPPTATQSSDSSSGSSDYSGSSGSGATHTIIVAPTQGVLRYVPFATNASVGDTIKFMWNANMHTVTHSSELEVCNKTDQNPFTSGVQNQSFTFTQVVNDTNPIFFYCGVPTHCQKGMFGIVNAPNANNVSTSVAGMMASMAQNDSNVAAWQAYAANMTANNSMAAQWGMNMDMSSVPQSAQAEMVANIMYTQAFLASNPDVMQSDGSINLGASSAPLMVPQDLSAALSSTSASGSASAAGGSVAASTGAAAAAGTSAASGSSSTSGAASSAGVHSLASSSILAVTIAVGAAFFAL